MIDPDFERRLAANIARRAAMIAQAMHAARHGDNKVLIELGRKWRRLPGIDRRRPRDSGMPAMAQPPRGPQPLSGGAAAPLEFDD
jgi:hypothetical protein